MADLPKSLICSGCQVAAQVVVVDDEVTRITCPSCGVEVEGEVARRMYLEQAQYFARKKAQDTLRRALSNRRTRGAGISISHRSAHLKKPRGPFVIEL